MIAKVVYYIRSESLGLFMGECLGFGFFEYHKQDGTLPPDLQPVQFEDEEVAQAYLDSWAEGPGDCFVEEGIGI